MKVETVYLIGTDSATRAMVDAAAKALRVESKAFNSPQDFLDSDRHDFHGCLLVELDLEGLKEQALQEALQQSISTPIVLLAKHASVHRAVRAIPNSTVTVLEHATQETLLAAVDQALGALRRRHHEIEFEQMLSQLQRLTEKEHAVLDLILRGANNRTIAEELGLSVRTIEARRKRIYDKTEASSLTELIVLVTRVQCEIERRSFTGAATVSPLDSFATQLAVAAPNTGV